MFRTIFETHDEEKFELRVKVGTAWSFMLYTQRDNM
jgi:hypothetical protein